MTEEKLISRLRDGDRHAFDELIQPYASKVYNIALSMLGDENDALDASQDTFLKVYRYIRKFNGKSSFYTWVYRITYNTCLDILKKRKKNYSYSIDNKIYASDGEEFDIQIVDPSPLPEDIIIKNETSQTVRMLISKLKPDYSAVVILRDIQGLSYDEIADILDLSVGTVKSRISRGRFALKDLIIKKYPELLKNFSV